MAQPRMRAPEMYIGAHVGAMASTVYFSPTVGNMSPVANALLWGANGGLAFRYSQQKYCAIQVELNYMPRGWREQNAGEPYTRTLHCIELPLLMHIYFGNPHFRGFFNLGPQIGYCVRDDHGHGSRQTQSVRQYSELDHPFDWGAAAGIGCYYRSDKAGIYQLEARFNYSMGGLFGTTATDHFKFANSMNVSINLAWMYEITTQSIRRPQK